MLSIFVSALVLAATFLQTRMSAKEAGDAHREAMDTWNVEDELVAEHQWWRHRSVRRELAEMRDEETARAIRHVETVLASWAMLLLAALAALVGSLWDFIRGF